MQAILILVLTAMVILAIISIIGCIVAIKKKKKDVIVNFILEHREIFGVTNTGVSMDNRSIYSLSNESIGL